ncbi:MAG: phenylalanine--tRNA ligase subunit alpha [Treponema sp.]|nr:phenylalanine--tRNA ligase subunit alpha [Treponema sp.]
MDIKNIVKNLHPLEVRILLFYKSGDELTIEKVEKDLNFKPGNGNQALSWLSGKGLLNEIRRETEIFYEMTTLGHEWKENGSPEERIIKLVMKQGALKMPDIAKSLNLENKDIGSAFGSLSKLGVLAMDSDKNVIIKDESINNQLNAFFKGESVNAQSVKNLSVIRNLLEKGKASNMSIPESELDEDEKRAISGIAKKRGASDAPFRQIDRETVVFGFTTAQDGSVPAAEAAAFLRAAGITGDEIGALTQSMLENGSWKGKTFRSYNVKTPPVRLTPGRSNPYAKFLENVKDKLASLGFEEFDGPLVETEFWNSDALFMPQFHSARDIHDAYSVAEPGVNKDNRNSDGIARAKSIDEPWLSNVASAHEDGGLTGSRGWNYKFDRDFTRRLILRSQGTVLSAKQLPTAKIPGKYFGIVRCFRYDRVDATHLPDFYQTEGIVLGENVNLRTLLGMLEMFAREVAGAKEIKYVPGYFPFTEPSIEVHIKHPVLGWFELGGSGIFRPEVTQSLGVNVPVAAWGIGIDRMALMALGLNDLRELFSYDIENVRLRRPKS